jgi:hypothetical protein
MSWESPLIKTWCGISVEIAIGNLKKGEIVKCELGKKESIYNIPDQKNPTLTLKKVLEGEWYVYTWAN